MMRSPDSQTRNRRAIKFAWIPLAAAMLGAAGGGITGRSQDAGPLLATLGGTVGGVLGIIAAALLAVWDHHKAATADRNQDLRRLAELADVLPLGPSAGNPSSPAWLLLPDNEVSPFRARTRELDSLLHWASSDGQPLIAEVLGAAGVGKSRLIIEFARRVPENLLVVRSRPGREIGLVALLRNIGRPTIIVVDLRQPLEHVAELLSDAQRSSGSIRVLVECRSSGWGQHVRFSDPVSTSALLDSIATVPVAILGSPDDMLRWVHETYTAAIQKMQIAHSSLEPDWPQFSGTSMAFLQAHAIAAAIDGGAGIPIHLTPVMVDIGNIILNQERRGWTTPVTPSDSTLLLRSVAIVCLFDPENELQAADLLRGITDLSDANMNLRHQIARWVSAQYPSDSEASFAGTIQPPIASGALYCEVARSNILTDTALTEITDAQRAKAMRTLISLVGIYPDLEELIDALIRTGPFQTLTNAISYALHLDDPGQLDKIISHHLTTARVTSEVLTSIETLIGDNADLPNLKVALIRQRLKYAQSDSGHLQLPERLLELSSSLDRIGQYDESFTSAAAALKSLDDWPPSEQRSALQAQAMHIEAFALARLGQHEEAIALCTEAIKILSSLAPLAAEYRRGLARCLASRGNFQGVVGDLGLGFEDLTMAEEHYRHLTSSKDSGLAPTEVPDFHMNIGIALMEADRHHEGLEKLDQAIAEYRILASKNYDRYRYGLAASLRNRADQLSHLDEHLLALKTSSEAVEVARTINTAHWQEYVQILAGALRVFSLELTHAGQNSKALAAITEAVALTESLDDDTLNARLGLTLGLSNRAVILTRMNRHVEALASAERSLSQARTLTREAPAAYDWHHAHALTVMAFVHQSRDDADQALQPLSEAEDIYRHLAENRAGRYLHSFSETLLAHARALAKLGKYNEASLKAIEAADAVREALVALPEVYMPIYTSARHVMRGALVAQGREADWINLSLRYSVPLSSGDDREPSQNPNGPPKQAPEWRTQHQL